MENIAYGIVTASATVFGGVWVASRPRTWLSTSRLIHMVAVGGGILLATLLFEMLPEAVEHGGPNTYWWIFAGLTAVVLMEKLLSPRLDALVRGGHGHDDHGHAGCAHDHEDHHDAHHPHGPLEDAHLISHGAACSAVGCLLVCTFFDGLTLTAGFTLGPQVGMVLGIGLFLHLLPEGVVAASLLLSSGGSSRLARRAAIAIGIALMAGVLFASVVGALEGFMGAALPFAAGVIAYVVLAQLMPVASRSRLGLGLFFGVAALFGVLERLIPHTH